MRKVAIKSRSPYIFLFAMDYRGMTSAWQGSPYYRKYGRELVSKPAISLKKSGGGYRRTTRNSIVAFVEYTLSDERETVNHGTCASKVAVPLSFL